MLDKLGKNLIQIAGRWGTCKTCGKGVEQYNRCEGCQEPVHRYECSRPYSFTDRNNRHVEGSMCKGCAAKPGGTCVKCEKNIDKHWGPGGENACSDCGKPMHRGCGSRGIGMNDFVCSECQVKLARSVR